MCFKIVLGKLNNYKFRKNTMDLSRLTTRYHLFCFFDKWFWENWKINLEKYYESFKIIHKKKKNVGIDFESWSQNVLVLVGRRALFLFITAFGLIFILSPTDYFWFHNVCFFFNRFWQIRKVFKDHFENFSFNQGYH